MKKNNEYQMVQQNFKKTEHFGEYYIISRGKYTDGCYINEVTNSLYSNGKKLLEIFEDGLYYSTSAVYRDSFKPLDEKNLLARINEMVVHYRIVNKQLVKINEFHDTLRFSNPMHSFSQFAYKKGLIEREIDLNNKNYFTKQSSLYSFLLGVDVFTADYIGRCKEGFNVYFIKKDEFFPNYKIKGTIDSTGMLRSILVNSDNYDVVYNPEEFLYFVDVVRRMGNYSEAALRVMQNELIRQAIAIYAEHLNVTNKLTLKK